MVKKKYELPYGEGSFYQRSNGLWVGTIEAGIKANGARNRITVSAMNKDVAWKKLRNKSIQLQTEGLLSATAKDISVKTWCEEWLKIRETKGRPASFVTDRGNINKWVIPLLGKRKLSQLTPKDTRTLGSAIMKAGLSSSTARKVVGLFQKALVDARQEGYKVEERVIHAEKPIEASNDRAAIPFEDAIQLLQVATRRPDAARWVCALLQGMRQGEVLGLTWDCIDFDTKTVDVSQQLQSLPYENKQSETFIMPHGYRAVHLIDSYHLVRPKTHSGTRVIPLVPWVEAALLRWREIAPVNSYDLVWSRPNGMPINAKQDSQAWKDLQNEAGIHKGKDGYYVLHEARHTTATLLLEAGVDPEVIKSILGHSDIVTSRGYMHVNQELKRKALEQVASALHLGG